MLIAAAAAASQAIAQASASSAFALGVRGISQAPSQATGLLIDLPSYQQIPISHRWVAKYMQRDAIIDACTRVWTGEALDRVAAIDPLDSVWVEPSRNKKETVP